MPSFNVCPTCGQGRPESQVAELERQCRWPLPAGYEPIENGIRFGGGDSVSQPSPQIVCQLPWGAHMSGRVREHIADHDGITLFWTNDGEVRIEG